MTVTRSRAPAASTSALMSSRSDVGMMAGNPDTASATTMASTTSRTPDLARRTPACFARSGVEECPLVILLNAPLKVLQDDPFRWPRKSPHPSIDLKPPRNPRGCTMAVFEPVGQEAIPSRPATCAGCPTSTRPEPCRSSCHQVDLGPETSELLRQRHVDANLLCLDQHRDAGFVRPWNDLARGQ